MTEVQLEEINFGLEIRSKHINSLQYTDSSIEQKTKIRGYI